MRGEKIKKTINELTPSLVPIRKTEINNYLYIPIHRA